MRFHDSAAEALRAGFRPCKRCQPDQPAPDTRIAAEIAELCRQIEASETPPSLAELARAAGLSASHLHRRFKAVTGLTPKGYAAGLRAKRIRSQLKRGSSVTEAIYAAGFGSAGRFYEKAHQLLGMKPAAYREGGANTQIRFAVGQCSLGAILVASSERGVCALLLGDDPNLLLQELQERFPRAELIRGDTDYESIVSQVVAFVEAPARGLALPLDIRGTAFQQRVWKALLEIPLGTTASYTQLAKKVGAPRAVRAVASACGANAIAVAIPCHRVVRNDGGLSGYRWGVERKRRLLDREKR